MGAICKIEVWGSAGRPVGRFVLALASGLLMLCASQAAQAAFTFDIPFFGDKISARIQTKLTVGISVRTEKQDEDRIAKNHLNPDVCGRPNGKLYWQSCQGLTTGQGFLAQHLTDAPGMFSDNFDQGNLNYKQWDITQAPFRLDQSYTFEYDGWKLYANIMAYYDPVNSNFTTYNPSLITADNFLQSGYTSFPGDEVLGLAGPGVDLSAVSGLLTGAGLPNSLITQLLANPATIPALGVRTDSTPCPTNRNPDGKPCGIVYGPGLAVRRDRTDDNALEELGRAIHLLNFNLTKTFRINDRPLLMKIGRQTIVWGGSTVEFFDSLNVFNPINLNNFFRVGSNGLDDFYTPVNAVSLTYLPTRDISLSGWYQLEYKPLNLPGYGTFYSPVNLDTENGGQDYVTAGFGNTPQDESGKGVLLDNPLTLISNTSSRIPRLPDEDPNDTGQFGIKLGYYAGWLNNGTDIALYYANYTSRIPMVSVWSSDKACSKDSVNTLDTLLIDCANTPVFHALRQPNDPQGATDSILSFDSMRVRLEYPDKIEMYGLTFNTNFGDIALQGELAYRPNDPLQVDIVDLVFAGLGPSLTNCHLSPGCLATGTPLIVGVKPDGSVGIYGSSDYTTANGPGAYADTIPLVVAGLPGSGRSFPNFIIPYRGGTLGKNPANSYIRGWEEFKTISLDFGLTYITGASDPISKFLRADQIVWLFEAGFRGVPDLPPLDELALAVPGTYTSPTAGADGSGANGSRQACSTNQACQFGPDGLRFNPHQAPLGLYPTKWSGGLGAVIRMTYGSVYPGVTVSPLIILKWDVFGHSPGYFSNYVEGRTLIQPTIKVSWRGVHEFSFRYQLWTGGGAANLFADRDAATFFYQYSF